MTMIAGSTLSVNSSGVVSGTANSLALALGQANALYTVTPALTALNSAKTAIDANSGLSSTQKTDAKAKIDDQKTAIVAQWNDVQAPLLIAYASAIVTHIATRAEISTVIRGGIDSGLQKLPASITTGTATDAPNSDVNLEGTIS